VRVVFADRFIGLRSPVPETPPINVPWKSAGLITTDEVLCEYLAFFVGARSSDAPAVFVVPQSRESFLAGLELYRARPDKGYSLTDCISMQTMRREQLTDVLANDRHFEQEEFRALFRDS